MVVFDAGTAPTSTPVNPTTEVFPGAQVGDKTFLACADDQGDFCTCKNDFTIGGTQYSVPGGDKYLCPAYDPTVVSVLCCAREGERVVVACVLCWRVGGAGASPCCSAPSAPAPLTTTTTHPPTHPGGSAVWHNRQQNPGPGLLCVVHHHPRPLVREGEGGGRVGGAEGTLRPRSLPRRRQSLPPTPPPLPRRSYYIALGSWQADAKTYVMNVW